MKPAAPPLRRAVARRPSNRPKAPVKPWDAFFAGARGRPVDPNAVLQEGRGRLGWLAGGLGAFVVALLLRSASVMLLPDNDLEALAKDQYQASINLTGRRGDLLDRRGRVLAMEVRLPTLYANPSKFWDNVGGAWLPRPGAIEALLPELADITGLDTDTLRKRFLSTANGKPRQQIKLGDKLDPAKVDALTARFSSDQLWATDEPVRVWPGRELAASLIGFVGDGDVRSGLERTLNHELTGDTYRMMRDRDRHGRRVEAGVDDQRLANAGHSVQLTVDLAIQNEVELALHHAMTISAPEAVMAVVVDVHRGDILAMASLPSGNPNDDLARADASLFKNRAALDQIEPGSVFKPYVAAAAIEEGLVTADTLIDCELGHWAVDDRIIRDDHPKGVIPVRDVIKYSSNIGAAKLGFKLGPHKLVRYLKDFGFGRETGLKIPGEARGAVRDPDKARGIEIATTAFGQGVTASPVQLAIASATLANGGTRMYPRLVDAIVGRDGTIEERREPVVDRQVVSEATARVVAEMMQTVTEEGGTGTRARVKGYRVAGKTGTAQKVEGHGYSETKRVASFVGFLPADNPQVAIAVVVDTPTLGSKYGGIAAGPIFAEIGAWVMQYLAVPPDPTVPGPDLHAPLETPADGAAPEEPVAAVEPAPAAPAPKPTLPPLELVGAADGTWVLPDLRGQALRSVESTLGPAGLPVKADGSGRVATQSPAPGSHVAPGTEVRVVLD